MKTSKHQRPGVQRKSKQKAGHPSQPVVMDSDGIARFKKNNIVAFLCDHGKYSLNDLAMMNWPDGDREQLAQLIGYSVSGFSDLHYASPAKISQAEREARKL